MSNNTVRPVGRVFIPSASFMVFVVDDPSFAPELRIPGRCGYVGLPEVWVSSTMSRQVLIRILAEGELKLKQTSN